MGPGYGEGNTLDSINVDGFTVRGRGVTPLPVSSLYAFGAGGPTGGMKYVSGRNIDPTNINGLLNSSDVAAVYDVEAANGKVTNGPVYSASQPIGVVNSNSFFSIGGAQNAETLYVYGGASITLTLPALGGRGDGITKCGGNYKNDTSPLKIQTGAAGDVIYDLNGNQTAGGGYVISSGAGGDNICLTTLGNAWQIISEHGTWTTH
ncbi:MAG: hypothetical protein H0U76_08535 [Ktedonobacteraceae bacterium]|nr:hypothetical protein [Ktedonobacteraceae bacterium]